MLILDSLSPAMDQPPAVIMGAAGSSKTQSDSLYGVVGVCSLVYKYMFSNTGPIQSSSGKTSLYPSLSALEIFRFRREINLYDSPEIQLEAHSPKLMQVVSQPKHGRLTQKTRDTFEYQPERGYRGTDGATFIVQLAGHRIKVIYHLRVTDETVELTNSKEDWLKMREKFCPRDSWLISSDVQNDMAGVQGEFDAFAIQNVDRYSKYRPAPNLWKISSTGDGSWELQDSAILDPGSDTTAGAANSGFPFGPLSANHEGVRYT